MNIKNERGLKGLNTYLGKNLSDTVLIFEATGVYSGYLQEYCRKRKIKTYVINPKRSSNFVKVMGHRSKTDETDAKALYAFKEIIKEQEIKLLSGDKTAKELKTYITGYEFIQKSLISVTNQIEALTCNINAPKVLLCAKSITFDDEKRTKETGKAQGGVTDGNAVIYRE